MFVHDDMPRHPSRFGTFHLVRIVAVFGDALLLKGGWRSSFG
jgi:hypothetical protein